MCKFCYIFRNYLQKLHVNIRHVIPYTTNPTKNIVREYLYGTDMYVYTYLYTHNI